MKDSERLRIPEIAELLKVIKDIDKVHYWEGWNGFPNGNIIEFMENGIADCDIFIPVFTETSLSSPNCQKERDMAIFKNKRIIPLFESFNLVPLACQPYLGLNLTGKNVNDIISELLNLITYKGTHQGIKPSKPIGEQKAPFKNKMVKMSEIEILKTLQSEMNKTLDFNEFNVNEDGSVISLDLSSLTFEKVPKAIFSLPNLMEINFSGSSFTTDDELRKMVFNGLVVKMDGNNYVDGQIMNRRTIKTEEKIEKEFDHFRADKAEIRILDVKPSTQIARGADVYVHVKVKNLGNNRWIPIGTGRFQEPFKYYLSTCWVDQNSLEAYLIEDQLPLPKEVEPGETIEVKGNLRAPDKSGYYTIIFSMLLSHRHRFYYDILHSARMEYEICPKVAISVK